MTSKFSWLLLISLIKLGLCGDKTVDYTSPSSSDFSKDAGVFYLNTFDDGSMGSFEKTTGGNGKYAGNFKVEPLKNDNLVGDEGLVIKEKAKHHGIAAELSTPFSFQENDKLVVQYEVNFQNGIDCGGAYIKLFADAENLDISEFDDKTKFSVMFGPDKCAADYKLHLIINHPNPKTGEFEEKQLKKKIDIPKLKALYSEPKTHLYKLILSSNSDFEILVDGTSMKTGNLLTDMDPEVNPPAEIVDVNDFKPEDWDDNETMPDPEATKPDDWDEDQPKKIQDMNAKMPDDWREDLDSLIDDPDHIMPEDWDEEMDGEYEPPQIDNPDCEDISGCGTWEPPMIDNPLYKGKWRAPQIKNPNYQGVWEPRKIANPNFFEDLTPYKSLKPIKAIALELWTMSDEIYFDNFLVANNNEAATKLAAQTFDLKVKQAKLNEPSLLEKSKKAIDSSSSWVKICVSILAGVPLLYYLYAKFLKKDAVEEPAEEEPLVEEEEKEEKVESEKEEEIGAGDNKVEEDKSEEEVSAKEPEKVDEAEPTDNAEEAEK